MACAHLPAHTVVSGRVPGRSSICICGSDAKRSEGDKVNRAQRYVVEVMTDRHTVAGTVHVVAGSKRTAWHIADHRVRKVKGLGANVATIGRFR